jgi:hypothetical protein
MKEKVREAAGSVRHGIHFLPMRAATRSLAAPL